MAADNSPFFILGCVRSGTTMLRNILRLHPNLCCAEETHFFRWAATYGTDEYRNKFLHSPVLKKHRAMDGISEKDFLSILDNSNSREELQESYMDLYTKKNKPEANRWFDKTPQNVYGILLIKQAFPKAKFLHIIRNPFNILSSLKIGKVLSVQNVTGGCNYWTESLDIINTAKPILAESLMEFRYEDFVEKPLHMMKSIVDFLGEEYREEYFEHFNVQNKTHETKKYFTSEELTKISTLCNYWMEYYGYTEK